MSEVLEWKQQALQCEACEPRFIGSTASSFTSLMYELRPSTPELLEPPKTWSLASTLSKCWMPHFKLNPQEAARVESQHHFKKQVMKFRNPTSLPNNIHIYQPTTWNTHHYPHNYLRSHLIFSPNFCVFPKFPHSPLHRLSLHLQLATNWIFETHQG